MADPVPGIPGGGDSRGPSFAPGLEQLAKLLGAAMPAGPETPASGESPARFLPVAAIQMAEAPSESPSGPKGKAPPLTSAPPAPAAAAGPGSGGSIFVPIAALLALLALAVPATSRRPRAAPNLLAPTRFVCALERPG